MIKTEVIKTEAIKWWRQADHNLSLKYRAYHISDGMPWHTPDALDMPVCSEMKGWRKNSPSALLYMFQSLGYAGSYRGMSAMRILAQQWVEYFIFYEVVYYKTKQAWNEWMNSLATFNLIYYVFL